MRALLVAALFAGGCSTFDPKHPLVGKPEMVAAGPAYWIWVDHGVWHLRITTGGRPHRFQGSIAGVTGGVAELEPTRAELHDRVALVGDSVQFDVEAAPADSGVGFNARVAGGCARIELYIDGKHRPDQVRLGPHAIAPHKTPFERCP